MVECDLFCLRVRIVIFLTVEYYFPFCQQKKHFATGFSGDIGDGPTTAYDALPPKKWSAKK